MAGCPSGSFGVTAASTSSPFGRPATTEFSPPEFGSEATATNSLFEGASAQSSGLFGVNTTNPAFCQPQAAQPAFIGFAAASSGLTSVAGTQQNALGFGTTATATGEPAIKFSPVSAEDIVVRYGSNKSVDNLIFCITAMDEYKNKSLEELRLEDYLITSMLRTENKVAFGITPQELTGTTTSSGALSPKGALVFHKFNCTSFYQFEADTNQEKPGEPVEIPKLVRERYEMKHKYAQLLHPIVPLASFLEILYRLRDSLLAQFNCEKPVEDLILIYTQLSTETKRLGWEKRFPEEGVYVDLDMGKSAIYYHDVLSKLAGLQSDRFMTRGLIKSHLDPLIDLLENYDSHFEKQDSECGIYNREFFEDVHSAKWVGEEEEHSEVGHYEMKNLHAFSARPFVNLTRVLDVLYSWRIWDEANWLQEEEHPANKLKDLYRNPLFLLKLNGRFPADGVYLDMARGKSQHILSSIVHPCGCETAAHPVNRDARKHPASAPAVSGDQASFQTQSTSTSGTPWPQFSTHELSQSRQTSTRCGAVEVLKSSLLKMLEDYESHWDDPENGIYDRAHFEKHFSALWIPSKQ